MPGGPNLLIDILILTYVPKIIISITSNYGYLLNHWRGLNEIYTKRKEVLFIWNLLISSRGRYTETRKSRLTFDGFRTGLEEWKNPPHICSLLGGDIQAVLHRKRMVYNSIKKLSGRKWLCVRYVAVI